MKQKSTPMLHLDSSSENTSAFLKKFNSAAAADKEPMMTFLSPEAIRWMNRRKPSASYGGAAHILPSRALQLRSIFKGLDVDGSGSIDLNELRDAVGYVAANDTSKDPIFKDPKKLIDFFNSMDTDGNGAVDFNEFLAGMTAEGASGTGDGEIGNEGLQQIFYDFANKHRRQLLLDRVNSDEVSDADKAADLKKLFGINYFKDENHNETVHERITRVTREVQREMKSMITGMQKVIRKNEIQRAREASLVLNHKLKTLNRRSIVLNSLQRSNIPDAEYLAQKIEGNIFKSNSASVLRNEGTHIPTLDEAPASLRKIHNVRLRAVEEVQHVKLKRLDRNAHSLLDMPPVSIKKTLPLPSIVT